ncbi:hypothetical protein [Micromonospora coxensis]|uniref:Restriction endonuclease n=1 Tax=Micromonospora coxensis TaxID=356852 RepID=A0A1C5GXH9_9ACTN|nr:hypothetical protein [Micromonospora coxensis]SCG38460.1 hypothetical protein GA0070614_0521 [Micromonospora coxensis]
MDISSIVDEVSGNQVAIPGLEAAPPVVQSAVGARAFGEENRARLLRDYFPRGEDVDPALAWRDVYRLLLWIDRTTGLAHCYESDKCQPGRPWYARSLAFHVWVAGALGVDPGDLDKHIDLLFRNATADLALAAAKNRGRLLPAVAEQRKPYEGMGLPEPGEDPELESIITGSLEPFLLQKPPSELLRNLTERIQAHVSFENKRKNLVGEGFEDTVAALLRRIPSIAERHSIFVRPPLHHLPGFRTPRANSKTRQVDLALVDNVSTRRTLVSCKWSVRSDREEQFVSDFRDYDQLEEAGQDFEYVLITNEFDPARLAAACEVRRQNSPLFTAVVHVNPAGLYAAYRGPVPQRGRGIARALTHIDSGRLSGLDSWLTELGNR